MRLIRGANGAVIGSVSSSGTVTAEADPAAPLGLIRNNECFADAIGARRLGFVDQDGRIIDDTNAVVGKVDSSGDVTDAVGHVLGSVEEPRDGAALLFLFARDEISGGAPASAPSSITAEFLDRIENPKKN